MIQKNNQALIPPNLSATNNIMTVIAFRAYQNKFLQS